MKFSPTTAFYLLVLGTGSICDAVEIREFDAAKHNRFVNYPRDVTENPSFYFGDEDWSGFGWSVEGTRKHFTLISPKYFVGARHFRPAIGSRVRFKNRDKVVKTYTVAALHDIANDDVVPAATDLFVGELVQTVADEDLITTVPVYNLPTEADYVNKEVVMSGSRSRAGLNEINSVADYGGGATGINNTRGFTSTYTEPGSGDDECYFEDGDSGGPSAVLTNNGFALVGTHSLLGTTSALISTTYTNFDVFVPHYMDRIDAVMEKDGYHVTRFNATAPVLTLSLSDAQDPAISSEGESYTLTVGNSATGEEAHNLRLDLSLDAGATFASVSGTDWVVENGGTTLRALRGGLDSNGTSVVTVAVNLPDVPQGPVTLSALLQADGSPDSSAAETTEVVQSFESYAIDLPESGPEDDPDRDGLSNLEEFVLGREAGVAEFGNGLSRTGDDLAGTYARRIYLGALGIDLTLQRSDNLDTWEDVPESELEVTPLDSQLEKVDFSELLDERAFFRFRISQP